MTQQNTRKLGFPGTAREGRSAPASRADGTAKEERTITGREAKEGKRLAKRVLPEFATSASADDLARQEWGGRE